MESKQACWHALQNNVGHHDHFGASKLRLGLRVRPEPNYSIRYNMGILLRYGIIALVETPLVLLVWMQSELIAAKSMVTLLARWIVFVISNIQVRRENASMTENTLTSNRRAIC